MKYLFISLSLIPFIFSCSSNENTHVDRSDITIINADTSLGLFFTSHPYDDHELTEIYWKKTNKEVIQISNDKQNISSAILNIPKKTLIYSQSRKQDKLAKKLEPILINAPYRFSDYVIKSYNLENNSLTTLLELSDYDINGFIKNIGLLNNGEQLAFQTNYGNIFIFNFEKPHNLIKFMPIKNLDNQFEFEDLYHMKTDGNKIITFDAKSGYKSHSDSSYVYNTYEYDLETDEIIQTTNHNFIYP